ncbi:hypothetical protein GWK47_028343 [Chionoecetes opilio]|uniref:Uncharacterized protein n=1 Tax=Chionoecetes opilio TaxID=41210 RepID=A0A8J4YT81_CHIOP|nr:hypothetical protein GWK47_028343 [Chionoecetes opilio]
MISNIMNVAQIQINISDPMELQHIGPHGAVLSRHGAHVSPQPTGARRSGAAIEREKPSGLVWWHLAADPATTRRVLGVAESWDAEFGNLNL